MKIKLSGIGCELKIEDTAIEFFYVFSRFEYALKASTTYLKPGRNRSAEADWDKFAADINTRGLFNPNRTTDLSNAVDYLRNSPPLKQVIDVNNQLQYSNTRSGNPHLVHQLVESLKIIRNNFFHGEKFSDLFNARLLHRDYELLNNGLVILYELLNLDSQIKSIFRTGIVS